VAPPPPPTTLRYRPPRFKTEEGGGGDNDSGSANCVKQPREIVKDAEEEEEEEEEDSNDDSAELSEAALKEKMGLIGVCPQNYSWNRGFYPSNTCGKCDKNVNNGYRCSGGSHYVCCACVNMA